MTVTDHRQVVAAKRDGKTLTPAEVEGFIEGYTRGDVSDALAASFLMACVLNGLDAAETLAMTRAMIASGETVSFTGLDRPTVDKHSTGGVSDGVTLVFAPLAAALGLARRQALGPGPRPHGRDPGQARVDPGPAHRSRRRPCWPRQVAEVGCAVAAQSPNLVPADGALYALRDATATVPSIAADRVERDVEEARGRDRPDPARREGRVGGLHEDARGRRARSRSRASTWPPDGGDVPGSP